MNEDLDKEFISETHVRCHVCGIKRDMISRFKTFVNEPTTLGFMVKKCIFCQTPMDFGTKIILDVDGELSLSLKTKKVFVSRPVIKQEVTKDEN